MPMPSSKKQTKTDTRDTQSSDVAPKFSFSGNPTKDIHVTFGETSLKDCSNWKFHAKVESKEIPMLFDTGSPLSIISKSIWEKLCPKRPKLEPNESKLTAANGSNIQILDQSTLKFDTEAKCYNWKFLIANFDGQAGIIGKIS
ncbi:hypothetical protein MAR_018738 [Mya arenaria]|uniref:Peptidase A2 domain-containing protein n=1 Tax=Mya arenaria TaxID=6604 RepID=A0ABY7EFI9_MYAAR|nr:hypothetical protein MAR_018738 [Mya arenaria]